MNPPDDIPLRHAPAVRSPSAWPRVLRRLAICGLLLVGAFSVYSSYDAGVDMYWCRRCGCDLDVSFRSIAGVELSVHRRVIDNPLSHWFESVRGVCEHEWQFAWHGSLHWRGVGHLPPDGIALLNHVNSDCVIAALDDRYSREPDMPERIATALKSDDSAYLRCIVEDVADYMQRSGCE